MTQIKFGDLKCNQLFVYDIDNNYYELMLKTQYGEYNAISIHNYFVCRFLDDDIVGKVGAIGILAQ